MPHQHRPPSGLFTKRYPLSHNFSYIYDLNIDSETKNSTILTLIRSSMDAAVVAANAVETNPMHANFAEETGPLCLYNSIIDKLTLSLRFTMSPGALATDNLAAINVYWMPIFGQFKEPWEALDESTGTATPTSILGLTKDDTNKDIVPAFSGVDVGTGSQALSTINDTENAVNDYNLTTNSILESVAFDDGEWYDAMQYYTIDKVLTRLTGRMNKIVLTKTNPHRNIFMKKFVPRSIRTVKKYCFFGILVYAPISGSLNQLMPAGQTTDIAHVNCQAITRYSEWHADHNNEIE